MSDLRFQLLGFPIAISPSFLVLLGVFALFQLEGGADAAALSLAVSFGVLAFLSILFHELGHALAARRFGLGPIEIVIHGFGGLTRYRGSESAGQSLWISLAGPAVNVFIGLAALGVGLVAPPTDPYWQEVYGQLLFVNLGWAVLNLLPLYPLDGGQALGAGLNLFLPGQRAWPITWGVGLVGGVLGALYAFRVDAIFLLVIAGSVAYTNWQAISHFRERRAA